MQKFFRQANPLLSCFYWPGLQPQEVWPGDQRQAGQPLRLLHRHVKQGDAPAAVANAMYFLHAKFIQQAEHQAG